jgi:Xaa-Pro aminopeptidase
MIAKGITMNKLRSVQRSSGAILLYAASEKDANLLYATDFFAPDPFMFFRTPQGRRHMVMSDLEIDRARATSSAHRVLSWSKYTKIAEQKTGKTPVVADVVAAVLRDFSIRSVTVPESFPVGLADTLRERKITVKVRRDPFFPERITKISTEVAEIRKSMRASEHGMRAAMEALKKSRIKDGYLIYRGRRLTSEMLKSIINTTILAKGFVPSGTIVAPGKQGCDPHDSGHGPIRAHEPIIIDIFPRSEASGYFGDITRTVVRGRASDKIRKMHKAVFDGQRLGLSMLHDSAKTKPIHQAILDLFENRGFPTGEIEGRMQGFFHGTGHGLGLEIHEPPRIAINTLALEKGMVVTVEPGLYYADVGGMRIEDTVLVTKRGFENLTRFSKQLEI